MLGNCAGKLLRQGRQPCAILSRDQNRLRATLQPPDGRAGQPAELAGMYVYLASDEASYVSGGVFPVTGGRAL